jgi:methionyl-tRNA formyltransferase
MSLSYVFFGTPGFCVQVLDNLKQAGRTPAGVVCQPDRKKGRGRKVVLPEVKKWAQANSIEVWQPENCKEGDFLCCFNDSKPDLGLVFAFGQLLPKPLLEIPRLGFINIHPSLLPKYRGAAPIQWTLLNGDQITGVSILKVTPKLDDGDIILQESTPIDPDENAIELGERLAVLGAKLVIQALDLLESGQASFKPQDNDKVVWAPALKKEDGQIDWQQSATVLHNRIRGLQPWPGAYTHLDDKVLKLHRAGIESEESSGQEPGSIIKAAGDDLLIACSKGILRLLEVQLEGKKRMDVRAFLLGRNVTPGTILGE